MNTDPQPNHNTEMQDGDTAENDLFDLLILLFLLITKQLHSHFSLKMLLP